MEKFTDQYFTYRQTPVSYDGIGNITRIKGNTLVWNQMACGGRRFTFGNSDYGSPHTRNGVTFEYTNDYTIHVYGTPTARAYCYVNQLSSKQPNVNPNDVLLLRCGNFPTGTYAFTSLYDGNTWISSGPQSNTVKYFRVPSATPTTGYTLLNVGIDVTASLVGTAVDFTVSLNLFNLTKMFGSGNEPTEAEFNSLFPSYYPYDSGSLLSFVGSGIKTTSADESKESTTDLPVLTYFPTGMKSAGSVYDELTPSKAITRIGSRAYQSGDESNTSVITDGTNTYYALTTPTEQNVDLRLMFSSYANGTEQILPTSDTSPFFGDIEYYNGTEGETNIRKFWLINGENERWDLTEKEFKAFLNNPQGLGFRKTVESVRYGERQNKVSETYNFPQPQGELLFYDSYNSTRYDKYNKFIRFLMNQPITLYYMIPVSYISGIANIYTLDCEVTEVQKTESKTDNILRSSIVFNGMEFYKGDPITVNGTGTSYTLTNDGDFPVGFEITVEGNLTNPYVTLSQDGELYGEAKFDSETAFSSVYVNSNDGEQNVILEQGGAVIPNPLSYQDLSISNGSIYVTFVKLARGVSELSIGAESGTVSSVKIEFTPMYRSV